MGLFKVTIAQMIVCGSCIESIDHYLLSHDISL